LISGGKFATTPEVTRNTRAVCWINAARKDFEDFPQGARDDLLDALTAVADGGHPSIAKPLTGLGSGVMELALRHRGDPFRVVYAYKSARMCGYSTPFRRNQRPASPRPGRKSTWCVNV
jgi:hypothetical protein